MAPGDSPRLVPFHCTACGANLRLPLAYLGKAILCPKCAAPQRFIDAELPMEPMDTTRALRADEIPERPIGALSGAARIPRHFPTPLPTDLPPVVITPADSFAQDTAFEPMTAPAARPMEDSALTGPARRREDPLAQPVPDQPELTLAFATPPAKPAVVVAPRSRSLVVVISLLGVVCLGLVVAVLLLVQALVAERERRREAEDRATAARASADESARQAAAIEARLAELIGQLARPPR